MPSASLRVVVAGSTGFLGSSIVGKLLSKGHRVVALTRGPSGSSNILSPSKASLIEAKLDQIKKIGATVTIIEDIMNSKAVADAIPDTDVFINTISPLPLEMFTKVDEEQKLANQNVKTKGARSLAEAAALSGSKVFLHQSIISCVKPSDNSSFDETSDAKDMRFSEFIEGEENVLAVGRSNPSMSVSILRCGLMYGPDSVFMQKMAKYLHKGKIPVVGDGSNLFSLVHVEDAALAFATLAEQQFANPRLASVYHVVDDSPVSLKDMLYSVAEKIQAEEPSRLPMWMAKLGAGQEVVDFVTSSTATTNDKLKKASVWRPKFPSLKAGLSQVVETWNRNKVDINSL
eukprot:TRINITY_DN8842_c0_g1_i1.p1 TRINITY_DN8842_c0_g1~~TRINITY_DN8842_c0_g1_i1.p1  ORF type:complete len:345 (-),score=49.24 TRINITY_DN8842_c0_g1_i1:71-1105(-)